MQYPAHGANAESLYQLLGLKMPDTIIDLSENVNPAGAPPSVKSAWSGLFDTVSQYPHEQAEPFRSKAARFHQVATEHIVVGNGAAECLMVLARFFSEKTVGVLEPSFSEYKRTLLQENVQVEPILAEDICTYRFSTEKIKDHMQKVDAIYLCNPNNPTGVLTSRRQIEHLLEYGQQVSCDIVVDEAFMDWTDETESVIPLIDKYENLIVLRSMTKMYAMAGIRLGYIISQQAEKFIGYFPHWNVSGMAIQIGCLCLTEYHYIQEARQQSSETRRDLTYFLRQHGCEVTDSAANFLLFKLPSNIDPDHFFTSLLSQGIVLRHTKNYTGLDGQWFRLALKRPEQMNIFKQVLNAYVQNNTNLPARGDAVE